MSIYNLTGFPLTPLFEFLILIPTFWEVPIEKYRKNPTFWEYPIYTLIQNPSQSSDTTL